MCASASKCYTSVQAAIDAAGSGATIIIAAGTFVDSLTIDKSVTLIGAGAAQTTISQSGSESVITINAGAEVMIKAVTISGGNVEVCPDAFQCSGYGGGINNSGTPTLYSSAVRDNSANAACAREFCTGAGGGIYNVGTLTLNNSMLTGKSAGTAGGGISNARNVDAQRQQGNGQHRRS